MSNYRHLPLTYIEKVGADMSSHSNMIRVNGVPIKTPSVFQPSLQDVSAADAGRTQDALMHKNRVAQKRKIQLAWNMVTPAEAHEILSAFADEYFTVMYHDPWVGDVVVRTFYSGDQEAPVRIWTVNNKRYEQISFDIIER